MTMKSRIPTEAVGDAHAYTRSRTPWIISDASASCGKLFHYISGGGMRTFGRTVLQEEARRRHIRFWAVASVIAALWLVLLIV